MDSCHDWVGDATTGCAGVNGSSMPPERRLHRSARVALGALGLVLLIVLIVVLRGGGSSERPVGAGAAQVGNARFDREAARCHLTAPRRRPANAGTPLVIGLSASLRLFNGSALCEETRLAQETGVQAVREDLSWAQAEPEPNRYAWTQYDRMVSAATEAGLQVLPVLDDPPKWAAQTETSVPSETGPYAAFAAAVVARYGPGGSFWRHNSTLPDRPLVWYELWNEPYWADHNRDPAAYARLVRAAAVAGRNTNPAAHFLFEAVDYYETPGGDHADWIRGMTAAVPDLYRHVDAAAVHPYGGDPSLSAPRSGGDWPARRLQRVLAELAATGLGAKPLWVTEIGWSTCSGDPVCVSEGQQARYLHTFLDLANTRWRSSVRAVFAYQLRDQAPSLPDDRDAWFGLLRSDLTRKPAWDVLHSAATALH